MLTVAAALLFLPSLGQNTHGIKFINYINQWISLYVETFLLRGAVADANTPADTLCCNTGGTQGFVMDSLKS
jgi:hypothetical protein